MDDIHYNLDNQVFAAGEVLSGVPTSAVEHMASKPKRHKKNSKAASSRIDETEFVLSPVKGLIDIARTVESCVDIAVTVDVDDLVDNDCAELGSGNMQIASCSSLQADLVSPSATAEEVLLVAEKQITMLPVHQQTHETITHPRQCQCDLCHVGQESCTSVTLCDRSIGCRLYIDPKHWCPCQK